MPRLEYPAELKEFEYLSKRWIWRWNISEESLAVHHHLRRDANMELKNTKKHKIV